MTRPCRQLQNLGDFWKLEEGMGFEGRVGTESIPAGLASRGRGRADLRGGHAEMISS